MSGIKKQIPLSVVKRLPRYLACMQKHRTEGKEWVSSSELAEQLGLTSSTVRQDFSYFDFSGISKRGYEITGLETVLIKVLGADMNWKMVVVGAGNLGRALARHEDFAKHGFNIVGIFDNDPSMLGIRIGKLTVQGMESLSAFIQDQQVSIGLITVPATVAQAVADHLIESGVKGLLNMALTHIIAPEHVSVTDSRVMASLLQLSHSICAQG